MARWLKWISLAAGALAGLLAVALAAGFVWLRGSLPQLAGEAAVPVLAAPVEVLRDGKGLVTIRAENDLDAYRALGYVHAQDRLAQMDLMRRFGAGRLSEVLGTTTLAVDRLMRTLGLYRLAAENLRHLRPETRAALDAYAEGVNAFLAAPGGPLPIEFQILRYEPEPWRPADSLVWGRLMALQLSGNWTSEALRLRLSRHLTPEQVAFLWPPYPSDGPVTLGQLSVLPRQRPALPGEVLPWDWAPKDASNAWVLAGARSASGKPLLANDLHLGLRIPGQWYLVRMETPQLTLAGATAPGVPFLIVGHNGRVAWAFTTTHSDTQDLFVERLSAGLPDHYDSPEGPLPFTRREEVIAVRGAAPLRIVVRATRHGPVISDARKELGESLADDRLLALAWPALDPADGTADAFYALNRAPNAAAFRAALESWHSPQQNILYADRTGRIGFMAPARVPLRPRGDGRLPVAGWSGRDDWLGEIPYADLPQSVDPPAGRLIVANNKIVPDDYPYLIAADWPSGDRARRIEQLTAATQGATAEQQITWQLDDLSLAAARLLPHLLATPPASERAARAVALLAAWDRRMARERPEPLIYMAWLRAANEALLADELGPDFPAFQRADPDLLLAILDDGPAWCDDIASAPVEDCPGRLAAALETALDQLEARFGRDMAAWRWGAAHVAHFDPPILGRLPLVGGLFAVALETDGGDHTVNRGGTLMTGPDARLFQNRHGPTFRAVYDLADLDRSRFMITGGQSGNLLSRHYADLAEAWRDGLYVRLDKAQPETVHRLLLTP